MNICILLALPVFLVFHISCNNDGFNNTIKFESIPVLALIPERGHPQPGNKGIITAVPLSDDSVELVWVRANDRETASTDLQYRVYRSLGNNINTPDEAEANGAVVAGWTSDIGSIVATGLAPGQIYYFNVLVKDADGNRSAYVTVSAATLNVPIPGNFGLISIGAVATTDIQIIWTSATDVETPASGILYRVYQSESNVIGSYAAAVAVSSGGSATLIVDWSANISTHTAAGLNPGKTYYFNVFAMDGDGNVSDYIMVSATTQSDAIYLFSAGQFKGNLTTPTSASPRADIDGLCINAKALLFPSLPCLNVRAFISITADDDIAGMPANFNVPTDRQIISPAGVLIAVNWSDLLDGTINENLNAAGIGNGFWWSGSDTNGNYNITPSCTNCNTCNSWSDGASKFVGNCGATNKTDSGWINNGGSNCNNFLMVLCICW